MHLPMWYNERSSKRSKHHRKHHRPSERRSMRQPKEPEKEVLPPHQQVQFLLGGENTENDGVASDAIQCDCTLPKLFTELEELHLGENGEPFWKETARYVYYARYNMIFMHHTILYHTTSRDVVMMKKLGWDNCKLKRVS